VAGHRLGWLAAVAFGRVATDTSRMDRIRGVSWGTAAAYAVMVAVAVAAVLAIRHLGAGLAAPPPPPLERADPHGATPDVLARLLLALLVVILAARGLGWIFRRLHQPPVIGEVVAGILLGPSLLGALAPAATAFLFPMDVLPLLGMLAQVGVVLFMFLVGLELDAGPLRQRTHAVVAISHASIAAPFVLGAALALALYPRFATSEVPFGTFALFLGVAMSITAFPVLARILRDHAIDRTPIGVLAISCAAVDDVTAWCLLAIVIGVARGQGAGGLVATGLALAYVAIMWTVVRPVLRRVVARHDDGARGTVALVLVGVIASALSTEAIGIHALFGAFLLGALVPHDSKLARDMAARVEDVVLVLLLPAFFAVTGLRTQLGLLGTWEHWLWFLAVLAIACAGKFGGAAVPARLTGLPWREAASLGLLMNTRGLMELIVLNIGLELRIISGTLFALLVLMAVATTVATGPLLGLLMPAPARVQIPGQGFQEGG
jgi:Kef-type K+ transport system membrane component KefB